MGRRATGKYPGTRMRRMRRDPFSRRLARETKLTADDLIQPLFVIEGSARREAVASMPGIERMSVDLLVAEAQRLVKGYGDTHRRGLDSFERVVAALPRLNARAQPAEAVRTLCRAALADDQGLALQRALAEVGA